MIAVYIFVALALVHVAARAIRGRVGAASPRQAELERQVAEQQQRLRSLSAVDHFVQYAKCERTILKLNKAIDAEKKKREAMPDPPILKVLSYTETLLPIVLTLWFWRTPVADLRPLCCDEASLALDACPSSVLALLLWPLSMPHGLPYGAVGASFWTMACSRVLRMLM